MVKAILRRLFPPSEVMLHFDKRLKEVDAGLERMKATLNGEEKWLLLLPGEEKPPIPRTFECREIEKNKDRNNDK